MGPLQMCPHCLVGRPFASFFVSQPRGMAIGPYLQRSAYRVAQTVSMYLAHDCAFKDTRLIAAATANSAEKWRFLHEQCWVSKENSPFREEEELNNSISEGVMKVTTTSPRNEVSVDNVLSDWVTKVGSRHLRSVLQETFDTNSDISSVSSSSSSSYLPHEQVARIIHAIMKDVGERGYPNAATQAFQWMQSQGWCRLDPHLYATMIDILGSSGFLDFAEMIFADMDDSVKKDVVLYNTLLHARSNAGQVEAALEMFSSMKEKGLKPDLYTYNTVMNMYVKAGASLAKVVSLFKEMCVEGIVPDVVSYDILLAACASAEYVKQAQQIFDAMKKRGVKPTVVSYTSLITVYANSGNFEAAMEVFREMSAEKCSPNVKTFTSLISACGRGGHIEEVRTVLEIMKESGIEPNAMTYNALIDMYFKCGKQNLAQDAFVEMVQRGLQPTSASFTILMSNFKTAGSYKEALAIYDQAKRLSTVCGVQTYTEALDTCAKSNNIMRMTMIMEDMKVAGCSPNAVTCSVVLVTLGSKCSSSNEVSQLLQCLESFESELMQCCCSLLTDPTRRDEEVTQLLEKVFSSVNKDDVKTWTTLSSSLLDALWALGWYRRTALALGWVSGQGIYNDICILTVDEWKLDIRRLSVGGAVVAFYQWLAHLLQAAWHLDAMMTDDDDDDDLHLNMKKHSSCVRYSTDVELLAPFFPPTSEGSDLELDRIKFVASKLLENRRSFPRIISVVTGWGKLSKEEGRSPVRVGVTREIAKLGVPFRESKDAGRWTANGEALLRWLLRPESAARLVLRDMASFSNLERARKPIVAALDVDK